MSSKEVKRIRVLEKLKSAEMTNAEASIELSLSIRQVQRQKRRYLENGAEGIVHKSRGRPSGRSLPDELKKRIVQLLHTRYPDFGPTFTVEKLLEEHGIRVSVEYIRQLQIKEGLRRAKKRRQNSRHHPRRTRRSRRGELIQVDGSDHLWFEDRGERCTLLSFIDDATSEILFARFVPSESYQSYSNGMKDLFVREGLPSAFYSDKHGVFYQSNEQARNKGKLTELGRNLEALGVEVICANSPQAKGRIERSFGTHQDRLVKELRLAGISDPEAGNIYLKEYLRKHNSKFSVHPADKKNGFRQLEKGTNLDVVLGRRSTRKLAKDLTFQYDKVLYQAQDVKYPRRATGSEVEIRETLNGLLLFTLKGETLPAKPYKEFSSPQRVLGSKEVSVADLGYKKNRRPHKYHPWR